MPQRTYYIDQLIISSPYEEPAEYWKYDRESRLHTECACYSAAREPCETKRR